MSNDSFRFFALKEVELYSLLLRGGLPIVKSFQRVEKGKRSYFTMDKFSKHYYGLVIKVNINSDNSS